MQEDIKGYKLFLDDFRDPQVCLNYMYRRIGFNNVIYQDKDWVVVKDYYEFVDYIKTHGMPIFVSFDHDLSDEHYSGELGHEDWEEYYRMEGREMTGYDCAKWLVDYCITTEKELPPYAVHSMNMVGTKNIISYLENYKKSLTNE